MDSSEDFPCHVIDVLRIWCQDEILIIGGRQEGFWLLMLCLCHVAILASAKAAVQEVVSRGCVHEKRIAIGGHSYGAFMAANLLAHCPELFTCGIARSGAYNRTLTPFSFQAEQRTLWQAPDVYIEMSPYMMADRIKKPLLLLHGQDDSNPGKWRAHHATWPLCILSFAVGAAG